jgi:chemotaxis protein methyltransferase CheR
MGLLEIEDDEFDEIRRLIQSTVGIRLDHSKRALVVGRLSKRLRHHGFGSFREYCDHLRQRDPTGSELREMINCITTNKTEFFRESHHFDWMREVLIPELRARAHVSGLKRIRIWSAGCSTGQEPYSIAMILAEELGPSGWDVRILASDIDTRVLTEARAAAYTEDAASSVPEELRRKYFKSNGAHLLVVPRVRDLVTFRTINLVETAWPIRTQFDVIFCRNVTIYFDRATQEGLYARFVMQLEAHGYLVAGHSENLHWLGRLLTPAGPTVYKRAAKSPSRVSRRPSSRARSRRPPKAASHKPPAGVLSMRPLAPPDVAIQSGGLFASAEPAVIRTVLGSCVAACVYDPEGRIGGMNHFMLPDGCESDWVPTRFGTHAMEALLGEVLKCGAERARLRAKIFGGAHVLRATGASNPIADNNIEFVRSFLGKARIPIQAESVGGDLPMQVRFETHTGRAFVRTLEQADAQIVVRDESRYRHTVNVEARESNMHVRVTKAAQ